jgi:hypothetical protein
VQGKKHTLSGNGSDPHCNHIIIVALLVVLKILIHKYSSLEMRSCVAVSSKDMAANFVRRALQHRVMVSSARQAVSGLLASGGAVAAQYLGKKMAKAWKSRA